MKGLVMDRKLTQHVAFSSSDTGIVVELPNELLETLSWHDVSRLEWTVNDDQTLTLKVIEDGDSFF